MIYLSGSCASLKFSSISAKALVINFKTKYQTIKLTDSSTVAGEIRPTWPEAHGSPETKGAPTSYGLFNFFLQSTYIYSNHCANRGHLKYFVGEPSDYLRRNCLLHFISNSLFKAEIIYFSIMEKI